ncbi:MAG: 50S ribosomal protein L10 [Parcubacteria group bacterium]|jgi:large subunit ribosomal protein L10
MLNKDQKKALVKDLTNQIKSSKVSIFTDFTGTSVAKMQELRRELRQAEATYKVSKKKLFDRAFKEAGIEADSLGLEGQIGLTVGQQDEVSAARILHKFAKANKNFKILRGVLGNQVLSDKDVVALAILPSKEELLAKLVGTINAPVSGFVNVLAGNLRNLVGVLKAIAEKA